MKKRLQKIVMIMAALLFSTTIYAQIAYKNVYGTPGNELPFEELSFESPDGDGTYFCGRTFNRPSLTLVDNCGKVVFSRIYNYQNFSAFTSMTFAPNGDILMHAVANEDWFVTRVDPMGTPIWGYLYSNSRERRASIIPADGDNYFVVGWWSPGGSSDDVTVLKINGAGTQLWTRRYNDVDDQVMDVISDQNGGLVACGGLHSTVDMFAIHLDQNGNIGPSVKYQQAGINRFEARAVTQTQNGHFVFLGVSSTTAAWNPTILTVLRTDANFNPVWQQNFNTGNPLNPVVLGVKEGVNGHIYFTTQATWAGGNYSITELDAAGVFQQTRFIPDIATVRFNLNGAEQYHLNDRLLIMGNTSTVNPYGLDDEILEMVDLNLNLCEGPEISPEPADVPLIYNQWSPTITEMAFQQTEQLIDPEEYLEFMQICECTDFPPVVEAIAIPDALTENDRFTIYPNISSGETIHLEYDLEEGETARLEVIELSTGRQIENLSIELNETREMTIAPGSKGLEQGIYQFRIIYSDRIVTRRLIVL